MWTRLKVWFWAMLAVRVCRHYAAVLMSRGNHEGMKEGVQELESFTERSGFLRDGRFPGGRHAERRIRKFTGLITQHNRSMEVSDAR